MGDISPALGRGSIDTAEWACALGGHKFGLDKVASFHPVPDGWAAQTRLMRLFDNKR